jgi:hypothetical protein
MPTNVNANLTPDQHIMLDIYTAHYRQVNNQINRLYDTLDNIRSNINMVMFSNSNTYNSNHSNYRNFNRNRNRNTRDSDIFYDYNNPINPGIYLDNLANHRNRNRNSNSNSNSNSNIYGTSDITSNISGLLSSFLNSTVIVRPTAEQIANASRLVSYNEIQNPNSESCPISLERFNASDQVRQLNHCGHIFLPNEFNEWFQSNVRCPVCRFDIRNSVERIQRTSSSANASSSSSTSASASNSSSTSANASSSSSTSASASNSSSTSASASNSSSTSASASNSSSTSAIQGATQGAIQGATQGATQDVIVPTTNDNISNVNVIRNPQTNIIDQVSFDISNNMITNDIVSTLTNRLFETLFNPAAANNNNDHFVYDPSNNILMYETIFRNINNNESNNDNRPHR